MKPRPPTDAACILLLAYLLARNAVAADRESAPCVLPAGQFDWLNMRGVESVALETWWDEELPVFRRSRARHRTLLREAATVLLCLYRENLAVRLTWRAASARLTSSASWRAYLGLPAARQPESEDAKQEAA